MPTLNLNKNLALEGLDRDPFWYKMGVIYELHVRAVWDNDGNGIGDFMGLAGKLDYLKDLGVTALWLLPFYPSPLPDDGYDIAYGTLEGFKDFLQGAHHRGLRVITELVMNYASEQHPWFERARRAKPGSSWRNFYVWSDTLLSFDYAAHEGLHQHVERRSLHPENLTAFEPWARFWKRAVSSAFLRSVLSALEPAELLPRSLDDLWAMLRAYLLKQAMHELGYDLLNRPGWLKVPLQGLLLLLDSENSMKRIGP